MNIGDFKKTSFNTNNGWGFGGAIGNSYKVANLEIRQGVASFRHLKQQPFTTAYIDGKRVVDIEGSGSKQLAKAIEILTDLNK